MVQENKNSYSWVKRIESALADLDETPLLASSFAFDWDFLTRDLMHKLQCEKMHISGGQMKWLAKDELNKGMSGKVISLPFTVSPIAGEVFWVMPEEDVLKLTAWLLTKKQPNGLSSEILQEGFYHYLLLETLDSMQKLQFYQHFSIKLNAEAKMADEPSLCLDVQITLPQGSVWGRLVLTPAFRKSWQEYFKKINPYPFSVELAQKYTVSLRVKIGSVSLPQKTYLGLHAGDFVVLDQATFDPKTYLGTGILYLEKFPLFQGTIKNHKCEIGQLVSYQEEEGNMEGKKPSRAAKNEEFILDENESAAPPSESASEETFSLKEVPVSLTVEIARIQMSLEKLMKLEPGNFLDMPVHPDDTVSLSVNGKKVGRAELVYLGDALGVRILELGK